MWKREERENEQMKSSLLARSWLSGGLAAAVYVGGSSTLDF